MESILLMLALATCAEDSSTCSYTELESGEAVVTACDIAPDKQGRPISFQTYLEGKKYTVTLEPRCVRI